MEYFKINQLNKINNLYLKIINKSVLFRKIFSGFQIIKILLRIFLIFLNKNTIITKNIVNYIQYFRIFITKVLIIRNENLEKSINYIKKSLRLE